MKIDIRNNPSFAVGRVHLNPNETINVEAGAMYQHSPGLKLTSEMQGGILGALKRTVLSGDSFFVSKFTAPDGGWVDLVPTYPGDVISLDVDPNNSLILTRGAWLASETGVKLDSKVGGIGTIIGGEGLFTVKCTGQGKVLASAYGAIDFDTLKAGESRIIDTGHLVAYEDGMRVNVRKAAEGWISSWKSGEGMVMEIHGPGDILTQSRNPQGFGSFVAGLLPKSG